MINKHEAWGEGGGTNYFISVPATPGYVVQVCALDTEMGHVRNKITDRNTVIIESVWLQDNMSEINTMMAVVPCNLQPNGLDCI